MTDPVDTDALRGKAKVLFKRGAIARTFGDESDIEDADIDQDASRLLTTAADEVDRLRAELGISENRAGGYEEVVAGLRAVIENAPHREHCRPHIACTCWKADAL